MKSKVIGIIGGKGQMGKYFAGFFKKCAKYLGDFRKLAMNESDMVLDYLGRTSEKTKNCDKRIKADIAILGPKNTYSDMAAEKYAPVANVYYASSINEVFELVIKNKVKEGIVPIENNLTGSIRETLDELYISSLWIDKVISQPIHLSILGNKKANLRKIKTIYSHAQPLLQSRKFIKQFCPTASLIPVSSTTAALERITLEKDNNTAAIASRVSAEKYGLYVIKDLIEDDKNNTTYFAVITKKPKNNNLSKAVKTSIAFNFGKDAPGSLLSVLQNFADAKINLTKIESRPDPKVMGNYVFYLDFKGSLSSPVVTKTLAQVKKQVSKLKILGCY